MSSWLWIYSFTAGNKAASCQFAFWFRQRQHNVPLKNIFQHNNLQISTKDAHCNLVISTHCWYPAIDHCLILLTNKQVQLFSCIFSENPIHCKLTKVMGCFFSHAHVQGHCLTILVQMGYYNPKQVYRLIICLLKIMFFISIQMLLTGKLQTCWNGHWKGSLFHLFFAKKKQSCYMLSTCTDYSIVWLFIVSTGSTWLRWWNDPGLFQ